MCFPVGFYSIDVLGRKGTCVISVLEDSLAKHFVQIGVDCRIYSLATSSLKNS